MALPLRRKIPMREAAQTGLLIDRTMTTRIAECALPGSVARGCNAPHTRKAETAAQERPTATTEAGKPAVADGSAPAAASIDLRGTPLRGAPRLVIENHSNVDIRLYSGTIVDEEGKL